MRKISLKWVVTPIIAGAMLPVGLLIIGGWAVHLSTCRVLRRAATRSVEDAPNAARD